MSTSIKKDLLFLLTALLFLQLFINNQAFAMDSVTLQLKWKHQFQFSGFYAAQKMGYFEKEGLDVTINAVNMEKSTSDIVLSGQAQYGISDSSLVLFRLRGAL